KFTQVVPSLRGLQTRAIPGNVFGGSSNRRPRSHHPSLTRTSDVVDVNFCTRTTIANGSKCNTSGGNTRRLLEKEKRFFCVRCFSKKLSLSTGRKGLGETPQCDSTRRLISRPRKAKYISIASYMHQLKFVFFSNENTFVPASFSKLFLPFGQRVSKGIIFKTFILVFQVFIHVFFRYLVLFLSLFAFIKGGKFFTMSTFAHEHPSISFTAEFHALMTIWTAGIRYFGDIFAVPAGAILTNKHAAIFIVYF